MQRMRPGGIAVDELLAHGAWLRGLARTLARDTNAADDLVQQTWLRALETPPRERAAGVSWLREVIRNLARDAVRRDGRRAAREGAVARPEGRPSAADLVARAEAQRRLLDAVVSLDEPFRTVVLMRFFEDLPPRDIARRTGVPAATVRTRLHRALATLRARLGGDGAAVLCLAGAPPSAASSSALSSWSSPWFTSGGLLVTTKQKAAALLVLVMLLVGGGAVVAAGGDPRTPADVATSPPATASPARPDAPQPRARAADPVADPVAAAAPADEPPVAAPAETVAPAPPPSLEVKFLRFTEPRQPPPGVQEIRDGERVVAIGSGGKPELSLGGGRGFQIAGWSRWKPVPPKGSVTWKGRVVDADGAPVAGADVLRVELDESGARASPSSFQWVRTAARTADDGTFEATSQPDGAFLAAANWNHRMNRTRGLDLASAVRVEASGAQTVAGLELRLPFSLASLGGARGVVRDEDGAPIRRASVRTGMQETWTDEAGQFALAGLDAGTCDIAFGGTGRTTRVVPYEIVAGRVAEQDVRLDLAVSGTLEISGVVVDEDGVPVASIPLFLGDGSREGARWIDTDSEGRFRFTKLPASAGRRGCDVMVAPFPGRDFFLGDVRKGVVAPESALRLVARRLVAVTVRVRSTDGAPIALFHLDVHAERPGEKPRQIHALSAYDEGGMATIHVPRGRLVIAVDGKDHRPMEVSVDIPDTVPPKEIVLEMSRE